MQISLTTTICSGTPTQFTCTSTTNPPRHTIISRTWRFSDKSTGSGLSPTHTYAHEGTYNVKLTVQTEGECTDSKTKTVTVSPETTKSIMDTICNDRVSYGNGNYWIYDWSFEFPGFTLVQRKDWTKPDAK